jgi:hypothetical protein
MLKHERPGPPVQGSHEAIHSNVAEAHVSCLAGQHITNALADKFSGILTPRRKARCALGMHSVTQRLQLMSEVYELASRFEIHRWLLD